MGKFRGGLKLATQWVYTRLGGRPGIYYLSPGSDWIIDWVGHYLTSEMRAQYGVPAKMITSAQWLTEQVIHYGDLWSWLGNLDAPHNRRNRVVATVFHGDRHEPEFQHVLETLITNQDSLERLVTASQIMADRFANWGIAQERIVKIPLGVDLEVFHPATPAARRAKREELGIPADAFCVGSFHKDGVGWDQGLEPKLIKGPDVFLEAIRRLSQSYKVHVLLSAPARGYVKQGLEAIGVSYTHRIFDNYLDIADYYHALDAYLIASREEGGPSGVVEAMASGIPLVSTRVGLAPDVARENVDAMICEVEDAEGLAAALARLAEDENLKRNLVDNASQRIRAFSWPQIAAEYFHQVYEPLLGPR